MKRERLIKDDGQTGETAETRLQGHWVIDRSSGRPALRLSWRTAEAAADGAADATSARVA